MTSIANIAKWVTINIESWYLKKYFVSSAQKNSNNNYNDSSSTIFFYLFVKTRICGGDGGWRRRRKIELAKRLKSLSCEIISKELALHTALCISFASVELFSSLCPILHFTTKIKTEDFSFIIFAKKKALSVCLRGRWWSCVCERYMKQ